MKVKLLFADDWGGLYIDDKLVFENNSLDLPTVLSKLGIDFEQVWINELHESGGRCPPQWKKDWDWKSE